MAAVRKERRRFGRGAAGAPRRVHFRRSARAARRAAAFCRAGVFRAFRIVRDAGFAFWFFGYLLAAPRRFGRPPRFVFFHAASVQRLKVPRSTWSRRAAPRAEISPFSQAPLTNSNSSGRSFGLRPKRTPRASAAAMPSA